MEIKNIIKLIRPWQWIKNLFVFIPLFFGGALLKEQLAFNSFIIFIAFCLISSSIYCLNDLVDAPTDRLHSIKKQRPIASGAVKPKEAVIVIVVLLSLFILLISLFNDAIMYGGCVVLVYFLINIAYCFYLKQFAIVDVCTIAIGFVLRIIAGGIATDIELSHWLVLMTFLITLFLSFAKRRDDVIRMNETGIPTRKNTIRYSIEFINQAITITASITLVCYIMYTVSPEVQSNFNSDYLYLTCIYVVLGLLRYIQLTVVDKRSGDPVKVMLRDKFTQIVVIAWGLTFFLLIYVL